MHPRRQIQERKIFQRKLRRTKLSTHTHYTRSRKCLLSLYPLPTILKHKKRHRLEVQRVQSGQVLNRSSQGCRARGLQGVVPAIGNVHAANATTWNQGAL